MEWDSNGEWDSYGHIPPAPPREQLKFDKTYYCSSYSAVGKPSFEDGGRITMPASALPLLMDMDVSYPMQFRIESYGGGHGGKPSHCGVLEFSAEEGFVYMPQWMMNNVGLTEGDLVAVANVALPKAEFLKLRPHSTAFFNAVENPKAVLEAAFKEHSCLTAGDTFVVRYNGKRFNVDVVEALPSDAVSVTDTDCEVDFDKALDYKEPEKPCSKIDDKIKEKEESVVCFKPFTGTGRTLDGKVSESENTEESSSQAKGKNGKIVFGDMRKGSISDGLREVKEKPKKDEEVKEELKKEDDKKFQAFTGKKYTRLESQK